MFQTGLQRLLTCLLANILLSSNTCDVLRFLKRNTFAFVHILAQVDNWISHPGEVGIGINIIWHKTKRLSSVNESGSPVITSLFGVRLIRMIEVEVGSLSQYNLVDAKIGLIFNNYRTRAI